MTPFLHLPASVGADARYAIGPLLGQGGMGAVYQAWDTLLKVPRAVKFLLPSETGSDLPRQRFEAEARALMRIDHPNVIRTYDVGDEPLRSGGRITFMVMELCEGGSPADWVARNGPMPPRLAIDVLVQVCSGLSAIHQYGCVHRDVKPSNVLVSKDGICKLTDFGIARLEELGGLTHTGAVFGTIGFMAPEQRRSARSVDERADVYGAAATLHALVTDRFEMDLFLWDQNPEVLYGVPEVLLPVLRRALALKPEHRTPSAQQFATELLEVQQHTSTIAAGTPPLVTRLRARPVTTPPEELHPTLHEDVTAGFKRQRTVLLVEDDDSMLELARLVLSDLGFRVLDASHGAEAMRVSDAWDGFIDLVVTDLVMPGESGAQLAGALRRTRPGVHVLLMSAHDPDYLAAIGIELGDDRMLQKPFTPEQLVGAIRGVLGIPAP